MIYTKGNQRLTIDYCEEVGSPREWSSCGYFITVDKKYHSPDQNETLEAIVQDTGEEATSQEDHIKLIKKEIKGQLGEKVLKIWPVVKYEHSGVSYSLGTVHGFDYSNNGFYIITDKSIEDTGTAKKDWERIVKGEIAKYNQWINGEVYWYKLEEKEADDICPTCGHNLGGEWEEIDSCCGYYKIDDIFADIDGKQKDWTQVED